MLALPSPDWLQQTVSFTGPDDQLAALREAAAVALNTLADATVVPGASRIIRSATAPDRTLSAAYEKSQTGR